MGARELADENDVLPDPAQLDDETAQLGDMTKPAQSEAERGGWLEDDDIDDF